MVQPPTVHGVHTVRLTAAAGALSHQCHTVLLYQHHWILWDHCLVRTVLCSVFCVALDAHTKKGSCAFFPVLFCSPCKGRCGDTPYHTWGSPSEVLALGGGRPGLAVGGYLHLDCRASPWVLRPCPGAGPWAPGGVGGCLPVWTGSCLWVFLLLHRS